MENKAGKKVLITDTTLRDGQQSLIATRMKTEEMLPILDLMDKIGFYSLEVWGGATFDACLRFLKEDPWERLREIKKVCKNTKLQMLFRGQNMLGYHAYPDDVVESFINKAIENGIDIIRIFDALNDIRNLESSVKAVKKAGGHAQLAISYTISDFHTVKSFVEYAKALRDLGADSICIKDMAGLLIPETAYELVKAIKAEVNLPLDVHSHCTSGLADLTYLRAIEAGVDIIDTAVSPFALGTSQPSTEVFVEALKGTPHDTCLDNDLIMEVAEYFTPIRNEALKTGLLDPKVLGVDVATLLYQVPGGMLSNLISQLKDQNSEDKFSKVLKEIPKVRADLGYPPLVTPTSQIVGTQAVLNVLLGERYKIVQNETKEYVKGMYGKTPKEISVDIKKKIIGDEKTITCKPSELLKPKMKEFEKAIGSFKEQDEDVLSYALFPQIAMDFFKFRQAQKYGIDPTLTSSDGNVYPI